MNQPWDISDINFLRIYILGFAATLLFAYATRILIRTGVATDPVVPSPSQLTTDELAYLAGGPRRVIEACVARLADSGALRLSRDGFITATPGAGGHDPVTRTVLADIARVERRSIHQLTDRLQHADAISEVRDRLVRAGLAVNGATARTRVDIGLLPAVMLLIVGAVWWANTIHETHPADWLPPLLLCSAAIVYVVHRFPVVARTFAGDQLLAKARTSEGDAAAPDTVDTLVAVEGVTAHPNLTVRAALLPQID